MSDSSTESPLHRAPPIATGGATLAPVSTSTASTLRSRTMVGPIAALAGVGAAWLAAAAVRLGDDGPSLCPWRSLTGLDCPFCGATRSAASLARGDVIAALDHNALFVLVILPLALGAWVVWAARAWRGLPGPTVANRTVLVLMGVTLGWWVLRLAVPWLGSTAG